MMKKCSWLPLLVVSLSLVGLGQAQSDEEQIREIVFPIVSVGPAGEGLFFQTSFSFTNLSDSTIQGQLVVMDQDGTNLTRELLLRGEPAPSDPMRIEALVEIKPGETVREWPVIPEQLVSAWAIFHWFGLPVISASAELSLVEAEFAPGIKPPPIEERPGGEVVTSTVFPATGWFKEIVFPVVRSRHRETAISFVEVEIPLLQFPQELRIQVLDQAGTVIAEFSRFSFGLNRISLFVSDILSLRNRGEPVEPLPDEFRGSVRMSGGQLQSVSAVDILFPELRFVNVAPLVRREIFD